MLNIYAGTSGYGYREWKGKFYPDKISPKEMLRFYAARLSTVEINNTFYRIPQENVIASWADQVGDDFVFAFKAPQIITHLKQLRNAEPETSHFFRSLSALDERKLGPILFQFSKSFHPDEQLLRSFLGLLPDSRLCAFEFRSPSRPPDNVLDLLHKKGCSLCIADTDESPAQEIVSTARWGYLRLRRSDYTDVVLSQWRERILSQQWEKAFVFFKHEESAKGPEMALRFRDLILPAERKIG